MFLVVFMCAIIILCVNTIAQNGAWSYLKLYLAAVVCVDNK